MSDSKIRALVDEFFQDIPNLWNYFDSKDDYLDSIIFYHETKSVTIIFRRDRQIENQAWFDVVSNGHGFLRPITLLSLCSHSKRYGIEFCAALGNHPISERFLKLCKFQENKNKIFSVKL